MSTELLAMARQYDRAGDVGQAEVLYRGVLQADPNLAEAWFHLGNALQEKGNLEEAVQCFRRCVLLCPYVPDAFYNLGNALQLLGQLEEAATAYQEAIRLRPDYALAYNNLGSTFLKAGRAEQAIEHFREAIRLQPDYAPAHFNLGNAYRENQQLNESLASYQCALRLKPDFVRARSNLAEAYLQAGDVQGAEAHFREALRIDPRAPTALCRVAEEGLSGVAEVGIDCIRELLTHPGLSVEDAVDVHFTLGDLLDRSGAYDEAFAHYRQANTLRREELRRHGTAFDADRNHRLVDEIIDTFTASYFERVKDFGVDDERPVFIVGMPRSGTTLVEQILSTHPDVFGGGELVYMKHIHLSLLSERLRTSEKYPACMARLDAPAAWDLALYYLDKVSERGGTTRRVTDKLPENSLHLGLIATLFRRARIIHCRREPLDICLSCYVHNFGQLRFAFDLEDIGRYYRDYERVTRHWRKTLPRPALEVVYEELIADPEKWSRRIVEFCGLPWNERCLRFHENRRPVHTVSNLQVRKPIYTTSVKRWQRYESHLERLRRLLEGELDP